MQLCWWNPRQYSPYDWSVTITVPVVGLQFFPYGEKSRGDKSVRLMLSWGFAGAVAKAVADGVAEGVRNKTDGGSAGVCRRLWYEVPSWSFQNCTILFTDNEKGVTWCSL